MKPSSQRALSFLISLLFMIGAIVVYAIFISPSNDSIQRLRGQVVNKKSELKQQEAVLKDFNDLLGRFHDLSSAQGLMSAALPNDPNASQLVNTLNVLANLSSIKIKNISIQSGVNRSSRQPLYVQNLGTAKISLSISGTYDNLKSFITRIERNVRIMDVLGFNISEEKVTGPSIVDNRVSGTPQPAPSMIFSVTMNLQAYYQEPQVQATSTRR